MRKIYYKGSFKLLQEEKYLVTLQNKRLKGIEKAIELRKKTIECCMTVQDIEEGDKDNALLNCDIWDLDEKLSLLKKRLDCKQALSQDEIKEMGDLDEEISNWKILKSLRASSRSLVATLESSKKTMLDEDLEKLNDKPPYVENFRTLKIDAAATS